ncbi:MAG: NADH-quinone oxidoreductase subunit C [Candidatus Omnitrophica bacterium]|nr:NADH-quinone oxidoreductase subunit C [Candidatus Omnitrophota bacterium]
MDLLTVVQAVQTMFPDAAAEAVAGALVIRKEAAFAVLDQLKNGPSRFISLQCLTAVDRKEALDVVYHLYSFDVRFLLTVKVVLSSEEPSIDSVASLWDAANWFEREVYDLFGIKFLGHPDLRRILNPDDWAGHPLRKSFASSDIIQKPLK